MLAIKGLKLPNSCYDCPIMNLGTSRCEALGVQTELTFDKNTNFSTCRATNCPIVEVQDDTKIIQEEKKQKNKSLHYCKHCKKWNDTRWKC